MKNIFQNHVTRIIGLSFLGFIIIAGYSMARASIDSLFLETYSNSALPKVWLLTSFVAALVMAVYNQYSARRPLMKLMMVASIMSAALLAILLLGLQAGVPYVLFLLYIWKDIYIVLLV